MAKLIFDNDGKEVQVPDGSSITDACEEAGIPIACGEGICGACVIQVTQGMDNLSECTQAEADFLGESPHERLACQCKIKHGTVKIKF